MELLGRVALVTGAGRRLGRVLAQALGQRGMSLAIHHHASSQGASELRDSIIAAGGRAACFAANLADPAAASELPRRVVAELGRLDVLVNSAGVGIGGAIDELPTRHLDVQLDVNLRGLMLVTAAALPLLRQTRGLVVNLASIAGTMGTPILPVYGAAKAAVIQFTQTINRGEQEHGVRATAISPGFVDTPMTDFRPVPKEEMIRPEDCAEIVRLLLRLSPYARVPHVVVERVGA